MVAEQFALLEAAYPGRIDLGIGRAPGTDPVTSWALRHGAGGVSDEAVAQFPSYVDNVISMMSPGGVGLQVNGRLHPLNATPHAIAPPPVWLLGSSDYSAQLAADRGLPYVFAHHFSGHGTAEALALYRSQFQPSEHLAEPRTFLTVNVVVAPTQEEADRLVLPNLTSMVALRTGGKLPAQRLVEEALAAPIPDAHRALAESMLTRWVVGTPASAAKQLHDLASTYDVDEVMLHPVAGAVAGTPRRRRPRPRGDPRAARRRHLTRSTDSPGRSGLRTATSKGSTSWTSAGIGAGGSGARAVGVRGDVAGELDGFCAVGAEQAERPRARGRGRARRRSRRRRARRGGRTRLRIAAAGVVERGPGRGRPAARARS